MRKLLRLRNPRWWPGTESNCRHGDFQSPALPTELPGHRGFCGTRIRPIDAVGVNPNFEANPRKSLKRAFPLRSRLWYHLSALPTTIKRAILPSYCSGSAVPPRFITNSTIPRTRMEAAARNKLPPSDSPWCSTSMPSGDTKWKKTAPAITAEAIRPPI